MAGGLLVKILIGRLSRLWNCGI